MPAPPSLLFINQHYHPAFVSAGQHLTDLAEYLAAQEFDVSVLCGRSGYADETHRAPRREVRNGVSIRRVNTPDFGRATNIGRIADYASFFVKAIAHLLSGPRYDCVVTLTTPPLLGVVGVLVKNVRRQPYGIWSMDLHPDAEEKLGMLQPGGLLVSGLHTLSNAGYRNADFVVDLGRHMKRRLAEKGVSRGRLHTLPVWNRKDEVFPVDRADNPLIAELGLEDRFVVMYSGNAGLLHRFDEVCEAMRRLRGHPDIYFLFVGGGPRREEIVSFASRHEIPNFQYLPYFPREQLKHSLSLAHVHLLTLRNDVAGIAVPGKLYGTMAAARPTLMVGPETSEPAETIQEGPFGYVVDPQKEPSGGAKLAKAITDLYENPEKRERMGRRARALFEKKYSREVVCASWAEFLREQVEHIRR